MRKIILIVTLLLSIDFVFACRMQSKTQDEVYLMSDYVISGKVISNNIGLNGKDRGLFNRGYVTFKVLKNFKGVYLFDTIDVYRVDFSMCMSDLGLASVKKGEKYFLYIKKNMYGDPNLLGKYKIAYLGGLILDDGTVSIKYSRTKNTYLYIVIITLSILLVLLLFYMRKVNSAK